jgi:SAM-dependent methyltransferase
MRERIEEHYTYGDLLQAIQDGLREAGKDPAKLVPADLAAVDEFHVRGREATLELAEQLGLNNTMRVLDVGSGLGGASRVLAADYGCKVTGIDLTEAYVQAASTMAKWVGLADLVEYKQGDALHLPFEDQTFDAAWTQHVAMNIPDKRAMYGEVQRVLKPKGSFAIYDVLQGAGGQVVYPVPWAREASLSFLITPDELRALLVDAGFEIVNWRDTTEAGRDWFRQVTARIQNDGVPALGFHLLLGPDFPAMAENVRRNLEENRTALIEVICRRT